MYHRLIPLLSVTALMLLTSGPALAEENQKACKQLLKKGIALHDAGSYDQAIAVYQQGLKRCGDGYGFFNEIGLSLAAKKEYERAAKHYLEEILHPPAPAAAFGNLLVIFGKLSAKSQQQVMALGSSADAPLPVPNIGAEYQWVRKVSCRGQQPKNIRQALIGHKGRRLDRLSYTCPNGTTGEVHFDFSADPTEQAFKKELQQMEKKESQGK